MNSTSGKLTGAGKVLAVPTLVKKDNGQAVFLPIDQHGKFNDAASTESDCPHA